MAQGAQSGAQPILKLGDAAVTGFSGVVARRPPAGGKAEDYFFIDRDGNSLVVFDMQSMKGPEDARLVDAPRKFVAQAKQIGQVFGVALDDRTPAPNIYVTATSVYGLNIVDSRGQRVKKGGPGVQWMPGQFGPGGGPGSIWKIEGATGKVSLFANVTYQNQPNSGPGLGNITFDPVSKHLFVSDLETGMVHRFDLNGRQVGIYDHGGLRGTPFKPSERMPITILNSTRTASTGRREGVRCSGLRFPAAGCSTPSTGLQRSGQSRSTRTAASAAMCASRSP